MPQVILVDDDDLYREAFPRQPKSDALAVVGKADRPPKWIKPQLTRLVEEAPAVDSWVHQVKYDG